MEARRIESRSPVEKPLDVLVQHLVTLALGGGFTKAETWKEVRSTYAYRSLSHREWRWALDFVTHGGQALRAGMPWWRYVANRFLTLAQNLVLRAKLSEYHTGYRGFTREVLKRLPLEENSDDFTFDNQMLLQVIWFGYRVGEISCPTRYAPDASSISFLRSVKYGFGCLGTTVEYVLARTAITRSRRFPRIEPERKEGSCKAT